MAKRRGSTKLTLKKVLLGSIPVVAGLAIFGLGIDWARRSNIDVIENTADKIRDGLGG